MKYSYNGLWKLLIDKRMKKIELQERLGLSPTTIAKMGKGKSVSLDVLYRICMELNADIGDLISIERENGETTNGKKI